MSLKSRISKNNNETKSTTMSTSSSCGQQHLLEPKLNNNKKDTFSISPGTINRFAEEYNNSCNDPFNLNNWEDEVDKEDKSDSISSEDSDWDIDESETNNINNNTKNNNKITCSPSVPPPWWYCHEEQTHLTKIFSLYTRYLNINNDCNNKDARRLSQFVGRVERRSVRNNGFTTLDQVEIFRRDIRPMGSVVSLMETKSILTHWNIESGIPSQFDTLSDRSYWENKIIHDHPVSYMHCLPVWESKTQFEFSVDSKKREVGYANEPFHYAPFIPSYLRPFGDFS